MQPIEPPSPQPSPDRRERGQAACRDINFCPATVIPAHAYARTGYVGNLLEILRNGYLKTVAEIHKVDSRLCGNDDDRMFGVVRS